MHAESRNAQRKQKRNLQRKQHDNMQPWLALSPYLRATPQGNFQVVPTMMMCGLSVAVVTVIIQANGISQHDQLETAV
jgi:hypothetical protein